MKKIFWLYVVLATGMLASCSKDPNYAAFDDNNFKITVTGLTGFIANDTAKVVIHIQTKGSTDGDAVTVGFPADGGSLLRVDGSSKVYLKNDTASFIIKAGTKAGTYLINSQFKDNVQSFRQTPIVLGTSYPDVLLVDASKSLLDTVAATTFTVTMKKSHGKVSQGLGIGASAYQIQNGNQVNVGRFTGLSPNVIDANAKITLTYFSDTRDFNFKSPVSFSFTATNDSGQPIQTIINLKFKY